MGEQGRGVEAALSDRHPIGLVSDFDDDAYECRMSCWANLEHDKPAFFDLDKVRAWLLEMPRMWFR